MTPSSPPHPVAGNGLREIPVDLMDEFAEVAYRAGFLVNHVPLYGVADKEALLGAFAQGLSFPEGMGRNWEALADALADLSWHDAPAHLLLLDGAAHLRQNAPDTLASLVDLIVDVSQQWAEAGIPFQVFLSDAPLPNAPG